MSRILVLYASHFGQTRSIAMRLAERLHDLGHDVELADARDEPRGQPAPEPYDAVVLGSRVEMGHHAIDLRRYIRAHRDALRGRPTAFFSVSMAAFGAVTTEDPNGYMEALFDDLDWRPTLAVALAGGLPYRKYGWLLRQIMKRISRSAGHTTDTAHNHEFTDWARVDRFAADIHASLPHPHLDAAPASTVHTAPTTPR